MSLDGLIGVNLSVLAIIKGVVWLNKLFTISSLRYMMAVILSVMLRMLKTSVKACNIMERYSNYHVYLLLLQFIQMNGAQAGAWEMLN